MNGLLLTSEIQNKDITFNQKKVLSIHENNTKENTDFFQELFADILEDSPDENAKAFLLTKLLNLPSDVEKKEHVRASFSDEKLFTDHQIDKVSVETLIEIASLLKTQPDQTLNFPTDSQKLKTALLDLQVQKSFKEATTIKELLKIAKDNGIEVKNFEFFKEEAALDQNAKEMVKKINSNEIFKLITQKDNTYIIHQANRKHDSSHTPLQQILRTSSTNQTVSNKNAQTITSNASMKKTSTIHTTNNPAFGKTTKQDIDKPISSMTFIADKPNKTASISHITTQEIKDVQHHNISTSTLSQKSATPLQDSTTPIITKNKQPIDNILDTNKPQQTFTTTITKHFSNKLSPIHNTRAHANNHSLESTKSDRSVSTSSKNLTNDSLSHPQQLATMPILKKKKIHPKLQNSNTTQQQINRKEAPRNSNNAANNKLMTTKEAVDMLQSQKTGILLPSQSSSQPHNLSTTIITSPLTDNKTAIQQTGFKPNKIDTIQPDEEKGLQHDTTPSVEKVAVSHETKPTHLSQPKVDHLQLKKTFDTFAQNFKEQVENYKPPLMKIKMQLNPVNLGEVDVTLINRGNNLQVNINSSPNTIALFVQNQAEFKNALVNMGFSGLQMNFGDHKENNRGQQHKQNGKNTPSFEENKPEIDSFEVIVPRYI